MDNITNNNEIPKTTKFSGGLDLAAFKINPGSDGNGKISGTKINSVIPVNKPGAQVWFQIDPDPQKILDVAVIELKSDMNKVYLVTADIAETIRSEIKFKRLYVGVTSLGTHFIYPVNIQQVGKSDLWTESALDGINNAMGNWTRVAANMSGGYYDIYVATGQLGLPNFPDLSIDEILSLAFRGRVIDSTDHPIIKSLRGESL